MRPPRGVALAALLFWPAALRADPPSWLSRGVVAEVTALALARAGWVQTAPMAQRARRAGWLPSVSLRVGRNLGATLTQSTSPNNADRVSADDALVLDLRVQFSLDRLAFDPSEVALARIEAAQLERRAALETQVIELLARLEAVRGRGPDEAASGRVEALRARARLEQLIGQGLDGLFPSGQ